VSKMSSVYLELHELGYTKVKEIEDKANFYKNDTGLTEHLTIGYLCREFNIDQNTAIMISSGSIDHKCSKLILENILQDL